MTVTNASANGVSQHNMELVENCAEYLRKYERENIGELADKFPSEQESLVIDWGQLFSYDPNLAWDAADKTRAVRDHFEKALAQFDLPVDIDLSDAKVRFRNITDEREVYVGEYSPTQAEELIGVTGQIRQLSQSQPQVVTAVYECQRCGTRNTIPQAGSDLQEPHECDGCERQGPFRLNKSKSSFHKHQLARVELPPEHADGADKWIDAHFHGDVADSLKGNERITMTGVLTMDVDNNDGRDLPWRFEGEHIEIKEGGFNDVDYAEFKDDIDAIAQQDDPVQYLAQNLAADSLYKDEKMQLVSEALICGAVGASRYDNKRADPHMMLVGDPGTGKSELLEAIYTVSPRSRYASGESVSGAGLTAAAVRTDFGPGEWTVKAGLLPRTNEGVVCIDELDKIPEEDKAKLHSALEKQQVDFAKGGEEAHLPARTTLLAAGNPKHGRFDQYESVAEQIDLTPTMLSRFDLMFTMVDKPERKFDKNVADAVLDQWGEGGGEDDDRDFMGDIPIDVWQAYIAYAHENIHPTPTDGAKERIGEKYVEIRSQGYDEEDGVPVTARKLEAFTRIAEASARARLSESITAADADRSIRLVDQSLRDVGLDPETGELDADVVETGTPTSQRKRINTVLSIIRDIEEEYDDGAPVDVVVERAEEQGISEDKAEHEIEKLKQKGELYEPHTDHLRTS